MSIETPRDDASTCNPCNCIDAMVMGCDMCLKCDREAEYKKYEDLERRRKLLAELIPEPFIHIDLGELKGLLPDEGKEKP